MHFRHISAKIHPMNSETYSLLVFSMYETTLLALVAYL